MIMAVIVVVIITLTMMITPTIMVTVMIMTVIVILVIKGENCFYFSIRTCSVGCGQSFDNNPNHW